MRDDWNGEKILLAFIVTWISWSTAFAALAGIAWQF